MTDLERVRGTVPLENEEFHSALDAHLKEDAEREKRGHLTCDWRDQLDDAEAELTRLRVNFDNVVKTMGTRTREVADERDRLCKENMRLQGRLAAMQDHHDAEHEKCACNALKEMT